MKPKRTYIAGPMRSRKYFNFPAFDAARDRLKAAGFNPVSPADIDRRNGFDPFKLPEDYDWNTIPSTLDIQAIIERDLKEVRRCDSYVLLDGWENSTGARGELGVLVWQQSVRYDLETLKPWFHGFAPHENNAPDTKPTNPKDMIGSDKIPFHLWPETATALGSLGLLDGALKYGRANFRKIGVRMSIYIDALRRHANALFEGEDIDPDSGLPHESHALACLAIIVDARAAGKLTDDRQYQGGYRKLVNELTPHVKRLKQLHAGKSPKHYTILDNTK